MIFHSRRGRNSTQKLGGEGLENTHVDEPRGSYPLANRTLGIRIANSWSNQGPELVSDVELRNGAQSENIKDKSSRHVSVLARNLSSTIMHHCCLNCLWVTRAVFHFPLLLSSLPRNKIARRYGSFQQTRSRNLSWLHWLFSNLSLYAAGS